MRGAERTTPGPTSTGPSGGSGSGTAVERYLERLRVALADLPAGEVAEVIDDARAHLGELGAELGSGAAGSSGDPAAPQGPAGSGGLAGPGEAALEARLGSPEAYAAELRAAAGYPPAPAAEPVPRPVRGAFALALLLLATLVVGVVAAGSATAAVFLVPVWAGAAVIGLLLVAGRGPRLPDVAGLAPVRALRAAVPAPGSPGGLVTGFVASLQPAWWLLRAVVAAYLLVRVIGSVGVGPNGPEWAPTLLVALVALPVSVWLGHLARRDRRWLFAVVPLNALAAALVTAAFGGLLAPPVPEPATPSSPTGLTQDGDPVHDIQPVDSTGAPLTGVYLFDQNGRPIVTVDDCDDGSVPSSPPPAAFPHGTEVYDDATGRCVRVPPAPRVVAVPSAGAAAPGAGTPGALVPGVAPTPGPTAGPSSAPATR